MNKYKQAAAKRFSTKFKEDFLINPISTLDAEIITELEEILKKGKLLGAAEIMKRYKFDKDSDIRDELLQFNMDLSPKVAEKATKDAGLEEEPEEKKREPFFLFSDYMGFTIKRNLILGFRAVWFTDKESGEETYSILLNEVPDGTKNLPMYSNFVLSYEDEDERNMDLDALREYVNS